MLGWITYFPTRRKLVGILICGIIWMCRRMSMWPTWWSCDTYKLCHSHHKLWYIFINSNVFGYWKVACKDWQFFLGFSIFSMVQLLLKFIWSQPFDSHGQKWSILEFTKSLTFHRLIWNGVNIGKLKLIQCIRLVMFQITIRITVDNMHLGTY